jgi:hypothetical protein
MPRRIHQSIRSGLIFNNALRKSSVKPNMLDEAKFPDRNNVAHDSQHWTRFPAAATRSAGGPAQQ